MAKKNYMAAFDSFLEAKVSHLEKNHKIAICAAALLIPAALFYYFAFMPNSKEIKGLHKKITDLEQELSIVKIKAAKLDEQKARMAELEVKFKEASEVIPDNKEIPDLLTNIEGRKTTSLDGKWNIIIDPMDAGYVGIWLNPLPDFLGFWSNRKPQNKSELIEYDHDKQKDFIAYHQ